MCTITLVSCFSLGHCRHDRYLFALFFLQPLAYIFFDNDTRPVREAVSYRGLFTAGRFGVREKHCSRLEIYDRLRASEQARKAELVADY